MSRSQLDPAKEAQIRRLLNEGFSRREIASIVGVARATVDSIANGTRKTQCGRNCITSPTNGRMAWCAECGAHVRMPCLKCTLLKGRIAIPGAGRRDNEPD